MTDTVTASTVTKTADEAKKTVKLIYEGKQLLKYIPKGQSPKLYIDLIKAQVMRPDNNGKERSDEDLLLFLYVAKRTGLDPLTKQIYSVFRWDNRQGRQVMAIQAGIDGMRLVAQRTGDYAGQDEALFTPEDESSTYPVKATVTVYKMVQGQKVAFSASARWAEYAPLNTKGEPDFMWKKMPYTMLGKCAEALALRKGFPNELSGVHSEEEMRQATTTPVQEISALPTPDKFVKEDKTITVTHGAPEDGSATPVEPTKPAEPVTPENIDNYADRLVEDSPVEQLSITEGTATEAPAKPSSGYEPDFGAMRAQLKAKGVPNIKV